jgi:hypothetical protein
MFDISVQTPRPCGRYCVRSCTNSKAYNLAKKLRRQRLIVPVVMARRFGLRRRRGMLLHLWMRRRDSCRVRRRGMLLHLRMRRRGSRRTRAHRPGFRPRCGLIRRGCGVVHRRRMSYRGSLMIGGRRVSLTMHRRGRPIGALGCCVRRRCVRYRRCVTFRRCVRYRRCVTFRRCISLTVHRRGRPIGARALGRVIGAHHAFA